MLACDEQSPLRGGEQEEPNEPPLKTMSEEGETCKVRVLGAAPIIAAVEVNIKEPYYHFNSIISKYGYYVKPVHKIYKTVNGVRRVYAYYGRYWWKKIGKKLIYAGRVKPEIIPNMPPKHEFEGITLIFEGEDVIMDCHVYERLKKYISGFSVKKTF